MQRKLARTHINTHTGHGVQWGALFVFCGCVFSWQGWVIRVSVRAWLLVCVCVCECVNMCSMAALSVGLLLLALSFFTLFTNCHHYCDYHHITQHTFIETGKCLLLWFI